MKRINLGQSINTLANIGVIAGLVFVGVQLRQDRQIAASAANLEAANIDIYWAEVVGQNGALWTKALADAPLTSDEITEFNALAAAWQTKHYTYYAISESLGVADPERFIREWALHLYSNPGLLAWWRDYLQRSEYINPNPVSEFANRTEDELDRLESGTFEVH